MSKVYYLDTDDIFIRFEDGDIETNISNPDAYGTGFLSKEETRRLYEAMKEYYAGINWKSACKV